MLLPNVLGLLKISLKWIGWQSVTIDTGIYLKKYDD